MSYILDALRRADAERQQGQVPGLNAAPAAGATGQPRPGGVPGGWWAAAILLVLVLVALGWAWALGWAQVRQRPAPALPAPASVSTNVSANVSATTPANAPANAPAATAPPLAASAVQPLPAALPIVVSAAPAPAADAKPVAPAVPLAAAAKPAASAPKPLPLGALPAEERRQLPPLVPGGSVWSDAAASRFVILDGLVLREGDAVAPGLVLERIERKAAVLRWKDQRVEVPF